jgi:hypothetical protein
MILKFCEKSVFRLIYEFFMGSVVIEVQIISQTEFVHFTGGQQKDTGSMGV